jgi:hypothetical protein
MKMEVVANSKKDSLAPVELYATRFARMCLLEHLCPAGHSVLTVENQLVSEARTLLHQHLLASKWNRKEVEKRIRRHAIDSVNRLTEDASVLKNVITDIQNRSLDDAFPSIN